MIPYKANGEHLIEHFYHGTSACNAIILLEGVALNPVRIFQLCSLKTEEFSELYGISDFEILAARRALFDLALFHSAVEFAFQSGFINALDDLGSKSWQKSLTIPGYLVATKRFENSLPDRLHRRLERGLPNDNNIDLKKSVPAFMLMLRVIGGAVRDPSFQLVRELASGTQAREGQELVANMTDIDWVTATLNGGTYSAEAIFAIFETFDWAVSVSHAIEEAFKLGELDIGVAATEFSRGLFGMTGKVGNFLQKGINALDFSIRSSSKELVIDESSVKIIKDAITFVTGDISRYFFERALRANLEIDISAEFSKFIKTKSQPKQLEAGDDLSAST